jgi:hypothetical protein
MKISDRSRPAVRMTASSFLCAGAVVHFGIPAVVVRDFLLSPDDARSLYEGTPHPPVYGPSLTTYIWKGA